MTSVWVVIDSPDYDNYDFTLYASREAAIAAIKAQIGSKRGTWRETFEGAQIEFQAPRAKDWRGNLVPHVWSVEEQEVLG